MFTNRRNVWIFVGALVVVVVAAVLVILSVRSQATSSTSSAYTTTSVQLGTLTSNVEGSGSVASQLTATLNWQTSGQVAQVNAKIGDVVNNGDVLATLEQSSTSVAALQAALLNAQQNLAELTSPAGIAAAQAAVAADQTALTNAQIVVNNLTYQNQGAIQNAEASLTLAQNALTNAQKVYNNTSSANADNKALAYQLMYGAQQKYNSALNTYNSLTGTASPATVAADKAAVALDTANLTNDQAYLNALTGDAVPATATGTSLLQLRQAQLAVQTAQQNLDEAEITAPFAGTITQSSTVPGQIVSPSTTAFRIDDLTDLVVTIQVVQIDVNSVKVGQPATIVFDAIPSKTYTGKVVSVDQAAGSSSSTTVDFNVAVQVTDADAQVKPGMTADVTVTTNQVANALLVPSTSIFTDTNGDNYVYLIENGTPTAVPVTVGATSDTSSQILGNTLKQGDTIVLAFSSTSSSSSTRGLGLGGGGLGFAVRSTGGGTP
jgi:HlyD family secretion protein